MLGKAAKDIGVGAASESAGIQTRTMNVSMDRWSYPAARGGGVKWWLEVQLASLIIGTVSVRPLEQP